MEQNELMHCGADMIYLAVCALHGKTPKRETVERMNVEAVYRQASRHSMAAVTYMALEAYCKAYGADRFSGHEETLSKWKAEMLRSIRRTLQFDLEREKIRNFLDAKGIWYMPLKGVIFQEYYPKLGMRQMGDNDILFDETHRAELRDFMEQNGYTVKHYDSPYPDTYRKAGMLFEMHNSLYNDVESEAVLYRYYRDVKDRLVKDENASLSYRFTDEDFYVYCTAHSYKHFSEGGHGIRSLMDVGVYLSHVESRLDWDYVARETEKLGIARFERCAAKLAKTLFDASCPNLNDTPELLDDKEKEILLYYVSAGTFGTPDSFLSNRLKDLANGERPTARNKLKYCMGRLFPSMDYYKLNHPIVYRHKVLIPFFLCYRALRGLFRKPRALWHELISLIKAK